MEESKLNYFTFLILGSTGMLLLISGISIFIYLFQRKLIKRKLAYQEISDLLKKQELRSTYAILEAQEKERKRIAEDLHDNLGSILVTLNMCADTLASKEIAPDVRSVAEKISAMAGSATEETRRLSHSLHSGVLKHFGLRTALIDLTDAVREAKAIEIITFIEIGEELSNDVAVNIYRMVQELIHNTLKHAGATSIRLEVTAIEHEYVNVIYEDNGCGFHPDQIKETGMGIRNIQARATRMNGQFNLQSRIGLGTNVIIEIPLAYEK